MIQATHTDLHVYMAFIVNNNRPSVYVAILSFFIAFFLCPFCYWYGHFIAANETQSIVQHRMFEWMLSFSSCFSSFRYFLIAILPATHSTRINKSSCCKLCTAYAKKNNVRVVHRTSDVIPFRCVFWLVVKSEQDGNDSWKEERERQRKRRKENAWMCSPVRQMQQC